MIEMRNRLIDLLQENSYLDVLNDEHWLLAAEQLLANGVIVPPCKVGDTVYDLVYCSDEEYRIFEMKVCNIAPFGAINEKSAWNDKREFWNMYLEDDLSYAYRNFNEIGKTVFLTKEEAEAELVKRSKTNA